MISSRPLSTEKYSDCRSFLQYCFGLVKKFVSFNCLVRKFCKGDVVKLMLYRLKTI